MPSLDTSVWSVNAIANAIRVPAYTVRRALQEAIRAGLIPDRRLGGHFRMVHSDDFPAVEIVLRRMGYQVEDRIAETLDKIAGKKPLLSREQEELEELRGRVEKLEQLREGA